MEAPDVEKHVLAAAAGCSPEGGSFDRRLTGLKKRGLIERNNGRVSLTEAGRILGGDGMKMNAKPKNAIQREALEVLCYAKRQLKKILAND